MRKIILWFSALAVSLSCFAQQTFSTRSYGVINTIYNSVQVLDDGYLTCGWTYDTIPDNHRDILLTKFNFYGENIEEYHYGNSSFESFTQENTRSELNNLYIQQASAIDLENIAIARLIWYNSNGDTIRTKEYYSPYYLQDQSNDFINPKYSLLLSDSTIYLTAGISKPGTANDVCIWHLDKDGNELWHYIYATEADPETCYAMIPWEGGVMAAVYRNINDSEYQSDLELVIVEENGIDVSIINESVWDNSSSTIQHMLIDDGYIICAGGVAEFPDLNSRLAIWKIDSNGLLIWSQPIGAYPEENNNTYYFKNLIKTIDGNYVVTYEHYSPGSETNSYHFNVRVLKMSSLDGSLLWNRTYSIVESQNDIHAAIDLKATPDGGVVFCGHASDAWSQNPNLELPVQQGWIVKLDACGCLVPGCDENCTVSVAENNEVDNQSLFLVGPNPAQDFLNIYLKEISGIQHYDIVFEIFDLSGRLVKSFSPYKGDTTYLLDTNDINAGEYLLLLKKGNELLQSQKIVVMK
ncbi:MAG: T9SS type A sorting domain-containing protein [Flavobacteriales bacterium]